MQDVRLAVEEQQSPPSQLHAAVFVVIVPTSQEPSPAQASPFPYLQKRDTTARTTTLVEKWP